MARPRASARQIDAYAGEGRLRVKGRRAPNVSGPSLTPLPVQPPAPPQFGGGTFASPLPVPPPAPPLAGGAGASVGLPVPPPAPPLHKFQPGTPQGAFLSGLAAHIASIKPKATMADVLAGLHGYLGGFGGAPNPATPDVNTPAVSGGQIGPLRPVG